jgi:large subunit ribosomal protein L14
VSRPKSRAVSARGVLEYKPHITRGLPVGSIINCTDNSGASKLRIISVIGYKGRLRRLPSACVGDQIVVSVRKGRPDLRKQIFHSIVVRQKKQYRRRNGTWIGFEDNAAILITSEGELRGSEIRGPVAREAAEKWPRIASASSIII